MKTITKAQYYQLVGLRAAYEAQYKVCEALQRAAVAITDERDTNGNPDNGGHTIDILWGERDLDEGLRIMGIEVAPE